MRCGPYELLERIGSGGMSEVHRARRADAASGGPSFAVKRLLPDAADEPEMAILFREEAELSMRLRHPHIVRAFDYGEALDTPYLALEWVDGVRLATLIRDAGARGGIPPAAAAAIASAMLGGLHYAHDLKDEQGRPLNVIHRDVSPQNVMVSYAGDVKIIDFGIAKTRAHLSLTETGIVRGTATNLSPEQCTLQPLDARSDIFSAGICLYEMLTGRRLYKRANDYETMLAIVHDPVPSVRDVEPTVPTELDAVVQQALQKPRELRYATAAEMQRELDAWLDEATAPGAAPVRALMAELYPDRAPVAAPPTRPWRWVGAAVALFALVAALTYAWARFR